MTSVPQTMRAVQIRQPGAAEVLELTQRPVPDLGGGEVLIRVGAAGVPTKRSG